jgi:WD40-like Beta Propeller Repeat
MRRLIGLAIVAMTLLGVVTGTVSAQAQVSGPNGQLAFARQITPAIPDQGHVVYTVDPDGSHLRLLTKPGDFPHWSPDGTEIAIGDANCMFEGTCAAQIINADSGASRVLPEPEPGLFLFCNLWSPNGRRLACGGGGEDPILAGIYTIRSSDGGGPKKVLSCDDCGPADYSPGGARLLFVAPDGDDQAGLFVIKLDGTELHQIPTGDVVPDGDAEGVSWSPSGNRILFSALPDPDHRRAIFVVDVNGTGLHQVPIPGCGGAFSDPNPIACFGPGWSPDGTKLAFIRVRAGFNVQNIYTANADGSGLVQVTHRSSGLEVTNPDWGTHHLE